MGRLRLVAALIVGMWVWWAGTATAAAHTGLDGSTPGDGAVVTEPLTEITFTFTAAVTPFEPGFALVVFDGSTIPIAAIEQPDPTTVVVVPAEPIEIPVEARWAIVSGDSHPVTGSILIAVDLPAPSTTSTTASTTSSPPTSSPATVPEDRPSTSTTVSPAVGDDAAAGSPPDAGPTPGVDEQMEMLREQAAGDDGSGSAAAVAGVIRWVAYATTALVIGGMGLSLLAGARGVPMWPTVAGWLWVGVIALAASTGLTIGAQLAELTDDAADVLSVGSWGDVLEGRFRTGIVVRLVGAVLAGIALASRGTGRRAFFAVGATAILASYPLLGHGDDTGWAATPSTIVHVAAISVWVGGLAAVLVFLRRGERSETVPVIRLFSGLAAVALVATVVAGIALTVAQLDAPSDLWSSDYGRRLLLKVVLVAAVAGIGAFHRYRTVPALEAHADESTAGAFVRLAALEIVGFAAVLAVTAWLVIGSG